MKYIIIIDAPGRKYIYNVFSVFEYEDGSVSEDTRIFESDNADEFVEFMAGLNR